MWSYLVDGLLTIDHPHQYYGGRSYAQHGDDFVLLNIFNSLGIEKPGYLDLGAHHPVELSNTYKFYERGSRGINVEANPDLIDLFRTHRPEDVNLNVGVGPRPEGSRQFYRHTPTCGLNSFDRSALGDLRITSVVNVEIMTVREILDRYARGRFPDLLSIDIEGLDLEVLQGLDFTDSAPKVICAEAQGERGQSICALLQERGFGFHFRAGGNAIFVHRDYLEKVRR